MTKPKTFRAALLLAALLITAPALAQNLPTASGTRVQGTPDGYGAPVQVTIVGPDGADVAGTPVTGTVGIDQTTPGTTNGVALKQIGSTTTATGNGVVGTGVQRVAIASDNTAFSITGNIAAGGAETGNLLGLGARVINTAGLPSLSVDTRANLYVSTGGNLITQLGGIFVGVDGLSGAGVIGAGNATTAVAYGVSSQLYDGSAFKAGRSIVNATNSTGTGIMAAGQLAQVDDTSPTAITENQFGNVRIGAQRQQLNSPLSVTPYSAILGTPAVQIRGASGNVANANAVATLTGTATTTVYISGFTCTPGGATAALLVDVAVTGTLGGTLTYTTGAPAGATIMGQTLNVQFSPPHPASAVNTPIVVTMTALGAGNTRAACVSTGFYM